MMSTAESFEVRARRMLSILSDLVSRLEAAEAEFLPCQGRRSADVMRSARNLVHYMALRQLDLRALQDELTALGLSSLGRAEGDVWAQLVAVRDILRRALGETVVEEHARVEAGALLRERSLALFGSAHSPAVMVTMPGEAANDPALVRALLEGGMDVMRINSAHDRAESILAMVQHLRDAQRATGRRCKVLVDLAGPKLRTLALDARLCVLRLKPRKNLRGEIVAPALVTFCAPRLGSEPRADELWVATEFLSQLKVGMRIHVRDTRGRMRELCVVERLENRARCAAGRTTYVALDTQLTLVDDDGEPRVTTPLALPAATAGVELRTGDVLELDGSKVPGHAAKPGEPAVPARVSCGLPELVSALRPGQRVLFDDGKIETEVAELRADVAVLRVIRARGGVAILRAEKGINVPDTELQLASLSPEDEALIGTVAGVADLIGLSFVRSPADVRELHGTLNRLGARLGIVLKIETARGFAELPDILLAALERAPVGVMIARGDLAVECGFERLAEIQEEMLWLCEAAHVPVIWATQVLENLAKVGQATRAEVTDAAMAERAECIMLNKGPYILEALTSLRDIIERMRGHQHKKRSTLRRLRSPQLGKP